MSKPQHCYGCQYLKEKSDAAGGGTYFCWFGQANQSPTYDELGGAVLGEWGHWTDERDEPKACEHFSKRGGGR